jgi:uncharacterized YkwD family protein
MGQAMKQYFKKRWVMTFAVLLTVFALTTSAWAFSPGVKGADVYAVQAMLQSMGYYQGLIDGAYGTGTASSVQAYQQARGLSTTGSVDAPTLRSIVQAYAGLKTASMTPSQTPAGDAAGTSGGGSYVVSQDEAALAALVNEARTEAGLPPLTVHAQLSRVARFKSDDMAVNRYFSHDSPTYGSPFKMMTDFGVPYMSAGENIACNQTVERAHEALMNSPGHRANILNTDFTHIGIGIVSGGQCGAMYTQMFLKP